MSDAQSRLSDAADKAEIGADILQRVAEGDENTEVPTAGGVRPSVAKWFKDRYGEFYDWSAGILAGSLAAAERSEVGAGRAEAAAAIAEDAVQYDYPAVADYAALMLITGMTAGQRAFLRDTEHVWRYSGASWADIGLGPTAGKADRSAVDALALNAERVAQRTAGMTELLREQNQFVDDHFERVAAADVGDFLDETGRYSKSGGQVLSVQGADGRAGMRFIQTGAGGAFLWMQSVSALGIGGGDDVAMSVRVEALSAGAYAEFSVVQSVNAGLSGEIAGTRVTRQVLAADVPGRAAVICAIHPDALYVGFFVRPAAVGGVLDCTDVLVARGRVVDFRPHIVRPLADLMSASIGPGIVAAARDSNDRVSAGMVDGREPNLMLRSAADFSALMPLQSGGAAHAVLDGVNVWRITCASDAVESYVALGRWPRSSFGQFVSAGVRVESVDVAAAPGAAYIARALLRQFDAAGVEIISARGSVSIATQSGLSVARTFRIEGVAVHPSCAQVDFYISVRGPAGRTMSFRDLIVCSGRSASWRPPAQASSATPRAVFVGPAGSDEGLGSVVAPVATLDRAIDMVGGSGIVYVLPGGYGPAMRITPGKITGHIKIIGVRQSMGIGNYEWPVIRMSSPVTGISKTPGYTKIYQASIVGLPPLASFQWAYQDGVADPRTLIAALDRSPQHRGRSHRLQHCARLIKATAGSLSAALDEMDATADPMSYIDGGTLYFTIVGGGDGAAANIYIDAATGFISSAVRGSCGALDIQGLRVMYGGINLSPFAGSRLDEVTAVGSRGNCIDYNVLSFGTLETACGGSQQQYTGDGLNGHNGAVLTEGNDLYSHDNWDDGFSDHEGCSTRMLGGGLVEYNGGTGLAPAYGADTVAAHFVSRRNQRRGTYKPAAFAVVGRAEDGGPADYGDTLARFIDCEDIESLTSFSDAFISQGFDSKAVCLGCRSIRPTTRGFNVYKVVNCGYVASATSTATAAATIIENTQLVS